MSKKERKGIGRGETEAERERGRDGHCPGCQLIFSSLRLLGDDDSDDGIESTLGLDRPDQDGERPCASVCCCWAIALVVLYAMQASTRPIASRA